MAPQGSVPTASRTLLARLAGPGRQPRRRILPEFSRSPFGWNTGAISLAADRSCAGLASMEDRTTVDIDRLAGDRGHGCEKNRRSADLPGILRAL
jgi:hypothetical protein